MLRRVSSSLGLVFLLSACATQQFDIANTNGEPALFSENQTFWVGGIGQQVQVDGAQACGDAKKVARVTTSQTAGNVVLSIVTLGIYTPRHIDITCLP
jgi:Bor protein